jgi:hypothetical protein
MIHTYMLQLESGRFIKLTLLVLISSIINRSNALYLFQTVLFVITGGFYHWYLLVINGRKEKEEEVVNR